MDEIKMYASAASVSFPCETNPLEAQGFFSPFNIKKEHYTTDLRSTAKMTMMMMTKIIIALKKVKKGGSYACQYSDSYSSNFVSSKIPI